MNGADVGSPHGKEVAVLSVVRCGVGAELLVATEPLTLCKEVQVIVCEEIVLDRCAHERNPFLSVIGIFQFMRAIQKR